MKNETKAILASILYLIEKQKLTTLEVKSLIASTLNNLEDNENDI